MKISKKLEKHLKKVKTWRGFVEEYNIIHKKKPSYGNTFAGMLELARDLNERNVSYLIIGGLAVASYVHQGSDKAFREWRGTTDIDLLASKKEAERALINADYEFGQAQRGKPGIIGKLYDYVKQDDGETTVVGLREKVQGRSGKDITNSLLNHKTMIPVHGVHIYVPRLKDLFEMKKWANRTKDRKDLKVLKKLMKALK